MRRALSTVKSVRPSVRLFVWLSVCLSDILVIYAHAKPFKIWKYALHKPYDRGMFLVYWGQILLSGISWFNPNECVTPRHLPPLTPKIWPSSTISRKLCEIGCKLLLFAHRKSHTGFRLVPESVTLNDLVGSIINVVSGVFFYRIRYVGGNLRQSG